MLRRKDAALHRVYKRSVADVGEPCAPCVARNTSSPAKAGPGLGARACFYVRTARTSLIAIYGRLSIDVFIRSFRRSSARVGLQFVRSKSNPGAGRFNVGDEVRLQEVLCESGEKEKRCRWSRVRSDRARRSRTRSTTSQNSPRTTRDRCGKNPARRERRSLAFPTFELT